MPYTPIDLQNVPPSIRYFVAERVEPLLRDVRVMLENTPTGDSEPALNLSIATVLCGAIGGLARVFYNEHPGDGDSFKATAARYPMDGEPTDGTTDPALFAKELYTVYRCGLVHSLGLHMRQPKKRVKGKLVKGPWYIDTSPERYVVARFDPPPLSDEQLAILDQPTGRLPGLQATLKREEGKIRLEVDALYCGVRRLVGLLATDPARQAIAVPVLKTWFESRYLSCAPYRETTSSKASAVQTAAFGGVDASTPAISTFRLTLDDDKAGGS